MMPFFTRLRFAVRAFFSLLFRGRLADEIVAAVAPDRPRPAEAPAPPPPVHVEPAPEASAVQVLAVLQRDGRLVDFLMEDITPYSDAQVGAAVRGVHSGCRDALSRYLSLAPVFDAAEGSHVTVEPDTDAARVKVIGNVAGQPPFDGVVRHRGWIVSRMELPQLPASGRLVVAPAEVEVGAGI
jgi:Domain of unknown function (DUF2760)